MSSKTARNRQEGTHDERRALHEDEAQVTYTRTRYGLRKRKEAGYSVGVDEQPRYVISIAAQILGVHPQTLRLYEREGLVEPQRSGGRIRLYSELDIERVRAIMRLTNDLGVNLAGAEAILNMRERMLSLHEEMEQMRRQLLAEIHALRRELDLD